MAIALLLIGFLLVASGIKNTQGQLSSLLVSDMSGAGNFWYYIAGLFIVGAIGYYRPAESVSRLTLLLILLVLVLSNGGVWAQLQNALSTASAAPAVPTPIASTALSESLLNLAVGSAAGSVTQGAVSSLANSASMGLGN